MDLYKDEFKRAEERALARTEGLKIFVTPKQVEWAKRNLDFDPANTAGYVVMEEE
jgi:hypothetical protein